MWIISIGIGIRSINGKILYIVFATVIKKTCINFQHPVYKPHVAVKPSQCWISGVSSGSLLRWIRKLVSAAISRNR